MREINHRTDTAVELPIWWCEDYMSSQNADIKYFYHSSGLVVPYTKTEAGFFVGFVGPYSLAYPSREGTTSKDYIDCWTEFCSLGQMKVTIRTPPSSHLPTIAKENLDALFQLGFQITLNDKNYTVPLLGSARTNRNRTRDCRKAEALGLQFQEDSVANAFEVILVNREAKNLNMPLSVLDFESTKKRFPSQVFFYSVIDHHTRLASAIIIKTSQKIAYVFMWGHLPDHENSGYALSKLAVEIIELAKRTGFEHLCLGVSSVAGVLDNGLAQFKSSLGAISEDRLTLERNC